MTHAAASGKRKNRKILLFLCVFLIIAAVLLFVFWDKLSDSSDSHVEGEPFTY